MSQQEKAATDPGVRSRLRSWLREKLKGAQEVSIPDLCRDAMLAFKGDDAFLLALADELLYPIVYREAGAIVSTLRQPAGGKLVVAGSQILSVDAIKHRASRWDTWLEKVGDRHINVMRMSRQDLKTAEESRLRRAEAERNIATVFRVLARRLEEGQVVADAWTPQQIEAVYAALASDETQDEEALLALAEGQADDKTSGGETNGSV